MKETLRLWPTAPAFSVHALEDTVVGGKYAIKSDHQLLVLLPALHREKSVWDPNPEHFNPDNFTTAAERSRPFSSYLPFGSGQRACIGRQFALHEAALVLGMVLHRFKLIDHHNYRLKIKETLTMKPDGLRIRVRPRAPQDRKPVAGTTSQLSSSSDAVTKSSRPQIESVAVARHDTPLLVLYGSNLSTAEELAQRIAQDGEGKGFATTVAPLDDYVSKLPTVGAVIVVSASYNGTPPDNAM